jgi:hypothetical protein
MKTASGDFTDSLRQGDPMKRSILILLFSVITMPVFGQMQPWLTRESDNARSGWNSHETVLTQRGVIAKGVSLLTVVPVIGDARGMEAQPLILPGVSTARGKRDVLVLPSMADVVRGVDAHDGSAIWQVSLGTPIQGSGAIDFHLINDKWGCLSTGVIDPDTARDYQVCWVSPDGSGNPATARYYMFVINVADGTQVVPPVLIDGLDFKNDMRKARSSAVLIKPQGVKTVLQCTGSVNETTNGPSGYCFAFDTATNKLTAMTATTQDRGAGIWMAGAGVTCDSNQDCYAMTGNGAFDGISQWGESFLKIRYTAASAGAAASIKVVDHWTPWTDDARAGAANAQPPNRLAGMSTVSEQVRPVGGGMSMPMANARVMANKNAQGQAVLLVYPELPPGGRTDQDLGSGGLAYIADLNIVCGGGKDGLLYCLHADNMGGTKVADFASAHANCTKLVGGAPVWATMDPGNIDPCPQDTATLNFLPFGDTAHLHSPPVVMWDPLLNAWTMFLWGENQQLHKWQLSANAVPKFLAEGREYASPDVRGTSPGGMPGGFCAGSSNGKDPDSYLLVCAVPRGDANANRVQGHILIYDPVHIGADGFLTKLWDSDDWGWSGAQADAKYSFFNKFMPPVIDGGEIILPNYAGGVLIIGQ